MRKNDEIIGIVSGIGSNSEGVIKIDNFVCFVPYALTSEKVRFKVLKVNKNIVYGKLIEVLTPAEARVRPRCAVYEKCGGCQLQHLKYSSQLKIKSKTVKDCLYKIAGIDVDVPTAVKSNFEYNYRNKLQLPIRSTDKGNKIGFFINNSHRIVEIENCPIQEVDTYKIINILKEFIKETNSTCFNEETGEGLLRHIVIKKVEDHLIFVLVINAETLKNSDKLIELLKNNYEKFSLFINVNKINNNVVLGEKYLKIYGDDCVFIEEFGIKYPVYPQSFMQVNNFVKLKLYSDVLKSLNLNKNTTVIDAYSGAGVMTAMLAKECNKAIGIEIVKEAVDSANILAKNNNLTDKMINYCGDCEELLPKIIKEESNFNKDVSVVLDPPRKGVEGSILSAILQAKPNKIVYVSCSPQSLARDLGILLGTLYYDGKELKKSENPTSLYEIAKIQPYDMFPQTKHVESVVCLKKKEIKYENNNCNRFI